MSDIEGEASHGGETSSVGAKGVSHWSSRQGDEDDTSRRWVRKIFGAETSMVRKALQLKYFSRLIY